MSKADELKKQAEEYAETKGKEHFREFYNTNKNIAELIAQVYMDCAVPREKRIEELEQQVKDLEWQLQEIAKDNENWQKENAELQHKVDTLQGYLDHDIEYDMDKQLVQAKKYIRQLLNFIKAKENGDGRHPTPYFYEEYEQFLKEIKEND